MSRVLKFFAVLAIIFESNASIASPGQVASKIEMSVAKLESKGHITYVYTVKNKEPSCPLKSFEIGENGFLGESQLLSAPDGWSLEGGIPKESCKSSVGWECHCIVMEESEKLKIRWVASSEKDAIIPGNTAKFEVSLSKDDPNYSKGDWTVQTVQPPCHINFLSGEIGKKISPDAKTPKKRKVGG